MSSVISLAGMSACSASRRTAQKRITLHQKSLFPILDKELIEFVTGANEKGIHVTKRMMLKEAGLLARKYGIWCKSIRNRDHVKRVVKILMQHQTVERGKDVPPPAAATSRPCNTVPRAEEEAGSDIQSLTTVEKAKSSPDARTLLISRLTDYSRQMVDRVTQFMDGKMKESVSMSQDRVAYVTELHRRLHAQLWERADSVLNTLTSLPVMQADPLCDTARSLMHQLLDFVESTIRYFTLLCKYKKAFWASQ